MFDEKSAEQYGSRMLSSTSGRVPKEDSQASLEQALKQQGYQSYANVSTRMFSTSSGRVPHSNSLTVTLDDDSAEEVLNASVKKSQQPKATDDDACRCTLS